MNQYEEMRENFTLIEVTLMYKMDVSINWAKAIWNETIAINEEIYKKLSNFWQNEENDNLKKKKVYWREKKYVHNFANLYGGASVMERSAKISNVDNILQDSQDNYLITECQIHDQYFVISLKEEIEIQQISLINRELFSSTIHRFSLYGSLLYPTEDWIFLGNYTASNSNDWQRFQIQPQIARYIKFIINDFYENEYFCIITQIKIFGMTLMADLFDSTKKSKKEQLESLPSNEKNQENDESNQEYQDNKENKENLDNLLNDLMNSDIDYDQIKSFECVNDQQDDTTSELVQYFDYRNGTCQFLDYVLNLTEPEKPKVKQIKDSFIEMVPYFSNQSIFKVTAQNIMILSHNQEMLKKYLAKQNVRQSNDQRYNELKEELQDLKKQYRELDIASNVRMTNLKETLSIHEYYLMIIVIIMLSINLLLLIYILKLNYKSINKEPFKKKKTKTTSTLLPILSNKLVTRNLRANITQDFFESDDESSTSNQIIKNVSR